MADDKTYTAEQYQALADKLKAEKDRASSLQEQLTEAKAAAAAAAKDAGNLKAQADGVPALQEQIATLRADLERTRNEGAATAAMLEAGVNDGSVRDYMLHLHGKHRAEAGDKAQAFGDWFAAQAAAPPAVLAPFVKPADPAAPKAPQQPRTETGARPAPVPPSPYTPGSVASMQQADFKARRAELVAEANKAMQGMALLGG